MIQLVKRKVFTSCLFPILQTKVLINMSVITLRKIFVEEKDISLRSNQPVTIWVSASHSSSYATFICHKILPLEPYAALHRGIFKTVHPASFFIRSLKGFINARSHCPEAICLSLLAIATRSSSRFDSNLRKRCNQIEIIVNYRMGKLTFFVGRN